MIRLVSIAVVSILCTVAAVAQEPRMVTDDTLMSRQFTEDFDVLWQFVRESYAYADKRKIDWERVREIYRPRAASAPGKRELLGVFEDVIGELYDHHAHLGANTATSPRLVPSGADLWAEWSRRGAMITEVRTSSDAERAGLRSGMEIISVDGRPVADAVAERLPKALTEPDPVASDWALRVVLAGRHNASVRVEVATGSGRQTFEFTPGVSEQFDAPLSFRRLEGEIGYVRINNALGDGATVAAFDSALAGLGAARGIVLDLRDTPGGGTSTVARGIMSRFITSERPYQKHELVEEERAYGVRRTWVEYVSPRGLPCGVPLVVLVGRWTGSMGEGVAIGLDGIGRGRVVGTRMAGLLGAISERTLPNSGIVVRIPTEKLYHIDGTPREEFVPETVVPPEPGSDRALEAALRILRK